MKQREKLYYLINSYLSNEYDTKTFSKLFTDSFYLEKDDEIFSIEEIEGFEKLAVVTSRFSPYVEDLKIPNVYFDESEVKKETLELIKKLNL